MCSLMECRTSKSSAIDANANEALLNWNMEPLSLSISCEQRLVMGPCCVLRLPSPPPRLSRRIKSVENERSSRLPRLSAIARCISAHLPPPPGVRSAALAQVPTVRSQAAPSPPSRPEAAGLGSSKRSPRAYQKPRCRPGPHVPHTWPPCALPPPSHGGGSLSADEGVISPPPCVGAGAHVREGYC